MTPGGDVGITGGAAGVLDPDRARREAAEQKLVMQISAEPEQLLIDPRRLRLGSTTHHREDHRLLLTANGRSLLFSQTPH
jgi:hypothetical protein